LEASTGKAADWTNNIKEIEGDLYRRWLRLIVENMKSSLDLKHQYSQTLPETNEEVKKPNDICVAEAEETVELFKGMDVNIVRNSSATGSDACTDNDTEQKCFNDEVSGVIWTTREATVAFKRGFAKAEEAKKIFILDGFVTDHVRILQDQSKLYHYLSIYENDMKRKLAMQGRRIQLLKPLLSTLSISAFDHIHKEVAYECAEAYTSLLETKMEKFRMKGTLDESLLKPVELKKCNEYCAGILATLSHLTGFYVSPGAEVKDVMKIENITKKEELEYLVSSFNSDPDESSISEEEVRLFLNAHFMAGRAMTKIFARPIEGLQNHAVPTVMALNKYRWLQKYAPELCTNRKVDINDVFKDEMMLCGEMVELLPAKIDRMIYHGESILQF